MSSVRTVGTFVFENAGPLTTAWAAPSECTVGFSGILHENFVDAFQVVLGDCSPDWRSALAKCRPHGEKMTELEDAASEGPLSTTQRQFFYSPGLQCPEAWETAGVVSFKDGSVDPSGVFASTTFQYRNDIPGDPVPTANFGPNALTSVLEPTETAVLCCPSGFSAHPSHGCYSHMDLTALASSTGCMWEWGDYDRATVTDTFEYFGATVTHTQYLPAQPTTVTGSYNPYAGTITISMDASGIPVNTASDTRWEVSPSQSAMEWAPFIYLVNSNSSEGSKDGENSDEEEDSTKGAAGGSKNGDSAAKPLEPAVSWLFGATALFWAASMAIGGNM